MLLKDSDFVEGCDCLINNKMKRYSSELQNLENQKDKHFAQAARDISLVLLHDVILLEANSYSMKYTASKKREAERIINELNIQIKDIQDSNEEEDVTKLGLLKEFLSIMKQGLKY